MTGREERIRAEAVALWRELYGEPPPISGEGAEMLEILLRDLPDVAYERLVSPHLRSASLTWAKR